MKEVHISKDYFNKGKRYQVIMSSDNAILLEVKVAKVKTYQVIDAVDEYPSTEKDLDKLNPFRTVSINIAEKEYARRNQTQIPD